MLMFLNMCVYEVFISPIRIEEALWFPMSWLFVTAIFSADALA
jgi:hypothetical protein